MKSHAHAVLRYGRNSFCVFMEVLYHGGPCIVDGKIIAEVDLARNLWFPEGWTGADAEGIAIGKTFSPRDWHRKQHPLGNQPIGVFDLSDVKQVQSMVYSAHAAGAEAHRGSFCDD